MIWGGPVLTLLCFYILAAEFGEGIVLPDQPRQLGERIAAGWRRRRGARRGTHRRLAGSDGSSLDAIVRHSVPGYFQLTRPHERRSDLAHFLRRLDSKEREAARQHRHDPLHQREPRLRRFWIILDNEA